MKIRPLISSIIHNDYFHVSFGAVAGMMLAVSPYNTWDLFSRVFVVALTSWLSHKAFPLLLSGGWKRYAQSVPARVMLSVIVLYATFACTYNQIVMATVGWRFTVWAFAFIILFAVFWLMAAFVFFGGLESLQQKAAEYKKLDAPAKASLLSIWMRVFGIIMLGYTFWLIASYPASVTDDSVSIWQQAIGHVTLSDNHSAFNALLLRFYLGFTGSPFYFVLSQAIIKAAIWASAALLLYEEGVPRRYLYIMAAVAGFSPNNGAYAASILKDEMFAIGLLAVCVSLSRILLGRRFTPANGLLLAAGLVFMALTRHNGMFPALMVILYLLLFEKRFVKIVALVSLAVIFIMKFPVYSYFNVEPVPGGSSMFPPKYAIGSVFYRDGKIDDNSLELMTEHISQEEWAGHYHPYSIDYYGWFYFGEGLSPSDRWNLMDSGDALRVYFRLFARNPGIMLRHHLSFPDIIYSAFQPPDPEAFNSRKAMSQESDNHGKLPSLYRLPNAATPVAEGIIHYTGLITILDALFWRTGIHIVLYLLLIYFTVIKGRAKNIILLLPAIVNTLIFMLVIPSQHYRYTYPVSLIFPFVFLFYLISAAEKEKEPSNKKSRSRRGGKAQNRGLK